MGERDVGELARRIREHADACAGGVQPAEHRAGVAVRPEVDGPAVGREALEQWAPVAELLVEQRGRGDAVRRHVDLDVRPPRDVLDPVVPERPGVGEDRVEIEGERRAPARC